MALIYSKFTSFAFPLRPLLAELELRATQTKEELGNLLEDCHHAWIGVRRHLINPAVEKEIKGMEPNRTPLVDLVNLIMHYRMIRACADGDSAPYRHEMGVHISSKSAQKSSICSNNSSGRGRSNYSECASSLGKLTEIDKHRSAPSSRPYATICTSIFDPE
jgi:hypothetical protein